MKLPPHKLRHGEACRNTITTKLESGSEMKIQAKYFPVSVEAVYYMKSLGNKSMCCISEFADGYIRSH